MFFWEKLLNRIFIEQWIGCSEIPKDITYEIILKQLEKRNKIENLIAEGLKEKLGQLSSAKSGNKGELQDRLLEHYGYSTPDDNGSEWGLLNV